MKLTDKYYGYPVISPISDDYDGEFSVKINTYLDEENQELLININVNLENEDIRNLLEKGKIKIVLHLEESRTCFREIFEFETLNHQIKLPIGKVRENIEVCTFLIVKEKIEFEPKSVHEFYKSNKIIYEPYQTIGIGNMQNVEISKEVDEIKDSSSIFSIIPDKTGTEKIIRLELREERIVIIMPNSDYNLYYRLMGQNKLKNRHKEILLSNIVMPIMVEVLQMLKDQKNLYEEKIWFKSLVQAYADKNIDFLQKLSQENFSPYYYAQLIFDSIISKSLNQLDTIV